jgi:hypothetical protein
VALGLPSALPAKSHAKANSAFKNFSLSKFAGNPTPSNHVPAGEKVVEVQRKVITQRVRTLSQAGTSNQAMTIAFPPATIQKLLPSFNARAATVDLNDVMTLIAKNMHGTEFYSSGNPTLNRLALQAQVRQIIDTIKGVKK